jgi:transcriptional regulator with GAF, ATPase, and Fis domain
MPSTNWKIAVASAMLGLCSLAAQAQAPETQAAPPAGAPHGEWRGNRGPERELEMLTHRLSLTPEQQTGVKAVLEQQRSQMKALRANPETTAPSNDTPETRTARMTAAKQIRDESNTKIAALLDETQKPKFAAMLQHREAEMARHQGEAPPPPPQN